MPWKITILIFLPIHVRVYGILSTVVPLMNGFRNLFPKFWSEMGICEMCKSCVQHYHLFTSPTGLCIVCITCCWLENCVTVLVSYRLYTYICAHICIQTHTYVIYIYIYALRYKPEGRGFDSRCHWNFPLP